MARIRSIKPEFNSDEKNLVLSDSCALFYVLLWGQCDDEGKIQNSPRSIAAKLCRWTQEKVKLFIGCLCKTGQLRLSSDSAWLQVTSWSHQRIDKPIQPKIKAKDIQWVDDVDSTNAPGAVAEDSALDRIGLDLKRERKEPSPNSVINPVMVQDASLNQPEIDQIRLALGEVFGSEKEIPTPLRRAIPAMLVYFENSAAFRAYLTDVWNEEPAKESNPSWRTYIEGRLFKVIRTKAIS